METLHVSGESRWKQAYMEALVTLQQDLLRSKVQAAQAAIENRLLELNSHQRKGRSWEVRELTDAQRVLRYLSQNET